MPILVYITENCKEDATKHGLWGDVSRFAARVEQTQSTSQFDPFPPPYWVKKKLGGRQGRLIADCRQVGEYSVIVFLSVLIRSSRAYEAEFACDPKGYGEKYLASLVSDTDISSFVLEKTKTNPPQTRPEPSYEEYGLLYGAFSHHQDSTPEDLICETDYWVRSVSTDRVANQLALFCKPCLDALKLPDGLHFLSVPNKPAWGLWVFRSERRLVLIAPSNDENKTQSECEAKRLEAILQNQDSGEVLRASRRAYPALVLADDELWVALEKDPLANMALSPEESEVLENTRTAQDAFPLFINGRAGSGKSTILQYLFADLIFYYLTHSGTRTMAPPIYLTANGELLRVARKFIDRILKSEATFTQYTSDSLFEVDQEVLTEAFQEFQTFLLGLIPSDIRLSQFRRSTRVDYARFRKMWLDRFGKDKRALQEYGPDLSWHVIRSYIKGMSSETYLEPDDYYHIPENQVTVTHDAFKQVFDRVWTGWYQRILQDENLWDDQDLARYILDNDLVKAHYPAVFCDEAQDFTRIELELLLRLNLFSNRNLQSSDICKIPFAFAGDPFQTLNPTGFRWDSIKASFVEKFIFALDPSRRGGSTDLNYRELNYNYRSTINIVRFCNLIQGLRAAFFQIPDIKPQIPWAAEQQAAGVIWFRANDGNFWNSFREHAGFVIIVPCNEGEESDFVSGDPILKEHIQVEDGVPINVLSAGRAKGREYPAVLVYGFGSASSMDWLKSMGDSDGDSTDLDPDMSLPLQYFINKLYVAVSRPKSRLVVVDTDEGLKKLWTCAIDESAESFVISRIKHGDRLWASEVEGMRAGRPEELGLESATHPLENAKAFEEDGRTRNDVFLLKQAAQAYRSAGKPTKAKECRARALEAEGSLLDAGQLYFEAGFAKEGLECLWQAGKDGWTKVLAYAHDHPQIRDFIEYELAKAVRERPTLQDVVSLLNRLAKCLDDSGFLDRCLCSPLWKEALRELLTPWSGIERMKLSPEDAAALATALNKIRTKKLALPARESAVIFYWAQRLPEAIELWEEAGEAKSQEYLSAKASVEPYPQRLITLHRMGKFTQILEAFDRQSEPLVTTDQAVAVFDALIEAGRNQEAYKLAWDHTLSPQMLQLALRGHKAHDIGLANSSLMSGLMLLVKQAQWDILAPFAKSSTFAPSSEWKEQGVAKWVESVTDELRVQMVRSLARSAELSDSPAHIQRQFSDLLRDYLRIKGGTWQGRLSIEEAGSAHERAGRFTDAVSFYEAVMNGRGSNLDKRQFAQERWLVCKQRQLEHERTQGSSDKVYKVQQELQKNKKSWRLQDASFYPEFPELPPLSRLELKQPSLESIELGSVEILSQTPTPAVIEEGVALDDQVSLRLGDLDVEFSRKNLRCNLTHRESKETAYVKIKDRICGGEVNFVNITDSEWHCSEWKLSVKFPEPGETAVTLARPGLGVHVQLQI